MAKLIKAIMNTGVSYNIPALWDDIIYLTQDEYDALSEAEKADVNKHYVITWPDGGSDSVTAKDVSYDNTTSGLTSINVQDAIDELNENMDDVKTTLVELEDTDIVDPTNWQAFVYNGTTKKWVNSNVMSGGLPLAPGSLPVKYLRFGTQADYDAKTVYYTDEENDTAYFTI